MALKRVLLSSRVPQGFCQALLTPGLGVSCSGERGLHGWVQGVRLRAGLEARFGAGCELVLSQAWCWL